MDLSEDRLRQRHARAVALLLQARGDVEGALPGFHGDRYADTALASRPARSAAEEQERQEELRRQRCSNCGLASIPGWTSSVQMSSGQVGRKRRQAGGRRQNMLETICACGWCTLRPGSDVGTKNRFKRRKLSTVVSTSAISTSAAPLKLLADSLEVSVDTSAGAVEHVDASAVSKDASSTKATRPLSHALSPRRQTLLADEVCSRTAMPAPTSATRSLDGRHNDPPEASDNGGGLPIRVKHLPRLAEPASTAPPARPLSGRTTSLAPAPIPTTAQAQPPKKKRTKRDGLQAMLAARKEAEAVKEKGGIGSLGLGNFLQGL